MALKDPWQGIARCQLLFWNYFLLGKIGFFNCISFADSKGRFSWKIKRNYLEVICYFNTMNFLKAGLFYISYNKNIYINKLFFAYFLFILFFLMLRMHLISNQSKSRSNKNYDRIVPSSDFKQFSVISKVICCGKFESGLVHYFKILKYLKLCSRKMGFKKQWYLRNYILDFSRSVDISYIAFLYVKLSYFGLIKITWHF